MSTPCFKEIYDKQGFVIVPSLVGEDVFPQLQAASERVVAKTRTGIWPYRRTVGRQFPPYGEDHPDSWGVQHVMHPDLGEPVFARWYTSDALIAVAAQLLECRENELQMELFNMLINPTDHDFALRWHRDDVRENASEEEERAALGVWHHGIQWNTALYEDSCLFVVPGSQRNPRTPQQRAYSFTLDPPEDPLKMPGAMQVILRGTGVCEHRCALLLSISSIPPRSVLLYTPPWDRLRVVLHERGISDGGKCMLDRLIAMKESAGEVGYSLDN